MKCGFWKKSIGIYVDGIEIYDIPIGEDDRFSIGTVYPGRIRCEMAEHPEKKMTSCTNVVEKKRGASKP